MMLLAQGPEGGDGSDWGLRLISAAGIFGLLFLAWLMSSEKRRFPGRIVAGGLVLQLLLAFLVFSSREITMDGRYPEGILFASIAFVFQQIQGWVSQGT